MNVIFSEWICFVFFMLKQLFGFILRIFFIFSFYKNFQNISNVGMLRSH